MAQKTNVVLVHGAWADGSSWSKVIKLLQQNGFNVTAAQIPLTSLADDITVTRNLVAAQEGPTVLVGHSYGGVVISGAANDAPNVEALVYIAAFALDEGESIEALSKQGPAPAGAAAVRPPDDHGFLWIGRDGFAKAFAADADPVEASVMAAVDLAAAPHRPGHRCYEIGSRRRAAEAAFGGAVTNRERQEDLLRNIAE